MQTQIVFFGSSPFSTIVLNRILNTEHRISAVVTTPDKPVGRHLKLTPNPIKVLAQKNNIPVIENLKFKIENSVGLVAAYGKIIPQSVIDTFEGHIYNVHPSLLPKYRGPSPLQQQILDGVTETGVTIIQLDAQADHGPIVAVAHDKILPDDTTVTLGNRLFKIGADLFIENLFQISNFKFQIQDEKLATFTRKLTRQDGFLPWEQFNKLINDSTQNRLFRALYPWPGVWTLDPHGLRRKLVSLSPLLIQRQNSPKT